MGSCEVFGWILSKRLASLTMTHLHLRRINTGRTLGRLLSPPTTTTSKALLILYIYSPHFDNPNISMAFFSSRTRATTTSTRTRNRFRNPLRRRDPDRVAGGYKAALSNPNTTRTGRKSAKRQLRLMVRASVYRPASWCADAATFV